MVEDKVHEEVLYREALAMGSDQCRGISSRIALDSKTMLQASDDCRAGCQFCQFSWRHGAHTVESAVPMFALAASLNIVPAVAAGEELGTQFLMVKNTFTGVGRWIPSYSVAASPDRTMRTSPPTPWVYEVHRPRALHLRGIVVVPFRKTEAFMKTRVAATAALASVLLCIGALVSCNKS